MDYIKGSIPEQKLSISQHAYCKGKSVETALHSLIYFIEKSFEYKEYAMVTFLDIEGAFNNVLPNAITRALLDLGVERSLIDWIDQMLKCRVIYASLGESTAKRYVCRGTPQGGVLSPLLWNLVINELLLKLEGMGLKVVAYADDVAIGVSGKYPDTLSEVMQNALCSLSNWTKECGLSTNPNKTELVLFSRKYKIPYIKPPTLNGIRLNFIDKAKYLGLILDNKLSWRPNLLERVRKASVALYSCKTAIGKTWGLEPQVIHWLYTAIVRPILLYGVAVWWPALSKITNLKLVMKIQRTVSLWISGALKSTPTRALEILLHLTPLDILGRQLAACSAIRLKSVSLWNCRNTGHASILYSKGFPSTTDYTIPSTSLDIKFTTVIPSKEDWQGNANLHAGCINIFTDGSKVDGKVGGGVFCKELQINLSFRLPAHCSVFQAEITAIREAVDWLRYNVISENDIRIFTDSQASIKALQSFFLKSKVVQNCLSSLNEMAEQFNIHLIWVPGHFVSTGNAKADELARLGQSGQYLCKYSIEMPLEACKQMLQKEAVELTNDRWANSNSCVISRQIWPKLNLVRSKQLILLRRSQISMVVGVVTGHCLIGNHARRLGRSSRDFCRSCNDEEEEETILHLLCNCICLAHNRHKFLGSPFFDDLSDIKNNNVTDILRFIKSSNWFVNE